MPEPELWMMKNKPVLFSISAAGVAIFCVFKTLQWLYKGKSKKDSYLKKKGIDVHIISTSKEWNEVYETLVNDIRHEKVLGLDCEWVLKGKVALLQLCTPNGVCVLLRLSKMAHPFPDTLVSLLADKSIIKTGVAVTNDGRKLLQDYGLTVVGCVDLRHLLERVRSVRETYNNCSKGLKGLSSEILHFDISKDSHIRCGNWEADHYSEAQIDYAATDAVVGVDIFVQLILAKMSENSNSTQEDFWTVARSLCQGVVDVAYTSSAKGGGESSSLRPMKKLKEDNKMYSTRKRPLWDNCILQAPDGKMLCTCDRRKAEWYLSKELADQVCDEPFSVRLRFEPSSRPESEKNYYLQEKENKCVCCGTDKDYVRKFVVPFEYKKFFPSALKDHCSHDVLLLCTTCHRQSSDQDSFLRQRLADECNAPIDSGVTSRTFVDQEMQKIRSAGRALKSNRNKNSIPPRRVEELEKILLDFFGVDSLSDELIENASEMNARQASEDYIPHGKRVVRHMLMNGGLLAFQARWRQHFLDTMNPQFLPTYWSVDFIPEGWVRANEIM